MAIRVGVVGATGRMGRQVSAAVLAESDLALAAVVARSQVGERVGDLAIASSLDTLREAGCDVAVDFTHPDTVVQNVRWYIDNGVHAVVGTTGIGAGDLDEFRRRAASRTPQAHVIVAPNFAVSAALMVHVARIVGRLMPDVEIVELTHAGKTDAPSGTALATTAAIAAARGDGAAAIQRGEMLPGARGAEADGIRIHSVRLPGLVSHQEVIFGARGQALTIRQDAFDRGAFIPGVLLAIRQVASRPGLTVGMDELLGL